MKFNFSLDNLLNFRRFAGKKVLISDLINYSVFFVLILAAALLIFNVYVFYLYFFGFDFSQDEKTVVSFSQSDYEKAIKVINEREKLFNDIAAENKILSPNPFR